MGQQKSKPELKIESTILPRDTDLILNFKVNELRSDITNEFVVKLIEKFVEFIPRGNKETLESLLDYIKTLGGSGTEFVSELQLKDEEIDQLLKKDIFKRIWLTTFEFELNHHEFPITLPNDTLITPSLLGITHIQVGRKSWNRIYNSNQGKSYTLLLQKLAMCSEALVIIKDVNGKTFGFYSFDPFDPQPKFYGSSSNFLFSTHPLRLYFTTGFNQNYLYFNHGQKSMINGIGLGGQMDYFGLFLDEDFNGHSRAEPLSTTYGNPKLSSTEMFTVDTIEVYQMAARELKIEKGSILDNYAASNLLEMSGRKMYSKDVK